MQTYALQKENYLKRDQFIKRQSLLQVGQDGIDRLATKIIFD